MGEDPPNVASVILEPNVLLRNIPQLLKLDQPCCERSNLICTHLRSLRVAA